MLGVGYDIRTDNICFSFRPTYHSKARGGKKVPVQLLPQDIAQLRGGLGSFSLRTAASYVMGQYDPLGLAAPLSLRAKLLLRRSHAAAES